MKLENKYYIGFFKTLFLIILVSSCNIKKNDNDIDAVAKQKIKLAFYNWVENQIEKGVYFAKDSCNWEYYEMKEALGLEAVDGYAVPTWDSSAIYIYYANLNADSIIDALITFFPCQCDGGNGAMWAQKYILVLSNGENYSVIDDYFDKFDVKIDGSFHLDSAAEKTVFGTYYKFIDDDPRCCPSIQRPIKIDLGKNEFQYLDNKKTFILNK